MEESNHQQRKITHYRAMILAAVVLVLTTLSFHGGLDNFAQERVKKTTDESMGLYLVSRSINAGISTLQSSQVVPFLASIQIGELLDPVNLNELGSFPSAHRSRTLILFSNVFFATGFIALSALLLASWERVRNPLCEVFAVSKADLDRYRDLLVRIFIVATIFRFIVPTFVVISSLVSQTFLETEINEHREKLSHGRRMSQRFRNKSSTNRTLGSNLSEQKVPMHEMKAREQGLSLGNYLSSLFSYERRCIRESSRKLDMVMSTTKLV